VTLAIRDAREVGAHFPAAAMSRVIEQLSGLAKRAPDETT
jgi:hypothetical protein